MTRRRIEDGMVTDMRDRRTYEGYLDLERVLTAQHPLSDPPHHDEMLFIIEHQVAELWIKLLLYELRACIGALQVDDVQRASKILARVKQIQLQMTGQWSVLDSLTPSEYARFRHLLGNASGFQSFQYRRLEFMLGNKSAELLCVFRHDDALYERLQRTLEAPSLYDEFLQCLDRLGLPVPAERLERDWREPAAPHPGVVATLKRVYEDPQSHWLVYELCERLVDLEQNFQLWRFRHMKTVERIIGYKRGTGGSSGVSFLRRVLDTELFPELYEVRTEIDDPD